MRRIFAFLLFTVAIFFAASCRARPNSPGASAAPSKPQPLATAAVAKPAAHAVTKPTAVIHTTVGNITCTLFPDKAPIGVA